MLIIKSQTGHICNCDVVDFNNYSDKVSIKGMCNNINVILGEYSDKRAKEVMEMIEDHINFTEHLRLFSGNLQYFRGRVPEAKNGLIFTMPKE